MAELADAYGSGSYFREEVQVQFLSGAPRKARFYRAFYFAIFMQIILKTVIACDIFKL